MPRRFKILTLLCLILAPVAWKVSQESEKKGTELRLKGAGLPTEPITFAPPPPPDQPQKEIPPLGQGKQANPFIADPEKPENALHKDPKLRECAREAETYGSIHDVTHLVARWLLIVGCIGVVVWFVFPTPREVLSLDDCEPSTQPEEKREVEVIDNGPRDGAGQGDP